MQVLKRFKAAGRRFVLRHPSINPLLRMMWRGLTVTRPDRRLRMPVLGTFGLDLPDRGRVRFSTQVEDWFLTSLYWKGLDRGGAMNLRVFRRLVTGCGTILDIGANIGLFSMAAALDSPTSVVHAFEPLPVNFQILSSMIRANRAVNIHAHELALSGHEGEAEFFVPRQAHGMSARDASLIAGFREDCERVPVRLATLDRVVTQHGLRGIDLIKVDVESAEYLVFPGASRVLRNERPVILCEVLYGTTSSNFTRSSLPSGISTSGSAAKGSWSRPNFMPIRLIRFATTSSYPPKSGERLSSPFLPWLSSAAAHGADRLWLLLVADRQSRCGVRYFCGRRQDGHGFSEAIGAEVAVVSGRPTASCARSRAGATYSRERDSRSASSWKVCRLS
jgi:FkbM family methyltransferase